VDFGGLGGLTGSCADGEGLRVSGRGSRGCGLGGGSFGFALRASLRMTAENMQRQEQRRGPIKGSFAPLEDDEVWVGGENNDGRRLAAGGVVGG